jgi:hypothetical protein
MAAGDALTVDSYTSWQWHGFTRSAAPVSNSSTTSSLASLLSSSYYSSSSTSSTSQDFVASALSNSGSSVLSGYVYYDEDGDGVREDTDWAIADATITLTAVSTGEAITVITANDGGYSFSGLGGDEYIITMVSPNSIANNAQPSVGTLTDDKGNVVPEEERGFVSGQDSIVGIQVGDDYSGINYDFALSIYPTELISKRSMINTDPGSHHTTPVPEPSALALLVVAGIGLAMFRRRYSA